MFEVGKIYDTRGGGRVRIICVDRPDMEYPIVGLYGVGDKLRNLRQYRADGSTYTTDKSGFDIVPTRRKLWALYDANHNHICSRYTQDEADLCHISKGDYWLEMEEVR